MLDENSNPRDRLKSRFVFNSLEVGVYTPFTLALLIRSETGFAPMRAFTLHQLIRINDFIRIKLNHLIEVVSHRFSLLYNTLFSREENFAKSEFEIFSREDIFANILFTRKYLPAKISSRENIFPRKYPPAKIVCLFRQRSFLFAVCCPVIGDTGSRPNGRS